LIEVTRRFSDRVTHYVAARPGYPLQIVNRLVAFGGWRAPVTVADLGSGTGLSARPFLDAGHRVFGVEPNPQMRAAAAAQLADRVGFVAIAGRAEATGLPNASVDLVLAAQAFHWFDVEATAREVRRILKPGGLAAVVWNLRRSGGTPFLDGYEALLREYGTDYAEVSARYAEIRRRWNASSAVLSCATISNIGSASIARACGRGCCRPRTRRRPVIRGTRRCWLPSMRCSSARPSTAWWKWPTTRVSTTPRSLRRHGSAPRLRDRSALAGQPGAGWRSGSLPRGRAGTEASAAGCVQRPRAATAGSFQ
jgi:SAM-dependent methyltransferase